MAQNVASRANGSSNPVENPIENPIETNLKHLEQYNYNNGENNLKIA